MPVRILGVLAAIFFATGAWAEAPYPSKPLRIIVPFTPGGLTDVVGRSIAQRLSVELGQQVIVENKPGAGGNIGAELAARSKPDGYTLLLTTHLLALNKSTYRQIGYDIESDLIPVGEIGRSVNAIIINPDLPVSNLAELIDLMKRKPNSINVAVPGSGPTVPYFAMVSGTQFTIVSYKGNAAAVIDLIAGRVHMMNIALDTVMPHLASGSLKALAISSSAERSSLFPDVPTMAETLPGFSAPGFAGITVPKGTPDEIVMRLNEALQRSLQDPDLRAQFEKSAIEITGGTPDAFGKRISGEVARWAPVIKATNAYVN